MGRLRQVTVTPGEGPSSDVRGSRAPTERPPEEETLDKYVGATIDGRYAVERRLGEGGMGVVYLCRHTIIDKRVAMKVLRADLARNEEVTERFLNEARSASSIGNPHIIDISDFGRLPDGATYFVMEYLEGTSLADLVDTGEPVEPFRVGNVSLQLTEALAAAHEAGIVHRDLKPDNIFLVSRGSDEDFVKILDFGIAKATSSESKLTQAGQVFGTPHYMSPEQSSGADVDQRSDIYALGVILYELITGRLPFDADNFMAILTQHMYKPPQPFSAHGPLPYALPEGLEAVILTCLCKKPEDRYQTMTELGQELRRVYAGELPISSRELTALRDSIPDSYLGRTSTVAAPPDSGVVESRSSRKNARSGHTVLYSTIGVLAALFAGTLVWALAPKTQPAPQVEAAVEPAPPPPIPAAETVVPELAQVAVAVAPLEAHVFRNGEDLGQSPIMLQVGDEPIVLEARLDGYLSSEFSVDGKTSQLTIQLEEKIEQPKKSVAPRQVRPVKGSYASAPAHKKKAPKIDSDGLVDPW